MATYLLIAGLVIFLFFKGIIPAWTRVNSDFANYYVSAKLIVSGESLNQLYNNEWFQQRIHDNGINTPGKFAPNPPLISWMMIPLSSLQPLQAQQAFTLINLIFLMFGIFILKEITHLTLTHSTLLILGGGLSLVNNFAFGQVYLIMTVFILLAILLHTRNYPWVAGFILGLFTALKYFPIIIIAGYSLVGLRRIPSDPNVPISRLSSPTFELLLSSVLTLLGLISIQFGFFGKPLLYEFFTSSFLPHLDGQLTGQGPYSLQFQSWDGLSRHLFTPDPIFNPNPFMNWPAGRTILKLSALFLTVSAMVLTLNHYKNACHQVRKAVFIVMPTLAALVVLPASATYHFVLLLVPIAVLISEKLLEGSRMIWVLTIYFLIGFIPYGFLFRLSENRGILLAYPRLLLMSLLFCVVTAGLLKKEPSPA